MLLRDLDFFILLAETRSFRQAAAKTGVTQPAITKGIHRLEDELGLALFERTRTGADLTEAGSAFLRRARQLQKELGEALREAADLRSRSEGLLRVGIAPSLLVRFFREPCKVVMAQRPAARFELKVALSDELFAGLAGGELDMVLSSIPQTPDPAFRVQPIGHMPLAVVAGKGHPLLEVRSLNLEQLCAYKWILPRRGVVVRDWLDRVFTSRGLPAPLVRVDMDTQTDALIPIVAGTDLLSIANGMSDAELLAVGLEAIPLPELNWVRPVGALFRANAVISPLAQRFVEVLVSSASSSMRAG